MLRIRLKFNLELIIQYYFNNIMSYLKRGFMNRGNKIKKGIRGPMAAGPGGFCVCVNPQCGHKQSHERGQPCYKLRCPQCGSPLVRKSQT